LERSVASLNSLYNLSKLSVRRLGPGICIERIAPGQPRQSGRHERMYLTLRKEITRPHAMNSLGQQARFDDFVSEFNGKRPRAALNVRCPAELYAPAPIPAGAGPSSPTPCHAKDVLVTACGRIRVHSKHANPSTVTAGYRLGIKEVDDAIWLATFVHYDLGYIDLEQRTLQPIDNPFG
jgi:hypothetical protein